MLGRPRVRMRRQIGEMTPIRTPPVSDLELRPAKSLQGHLISLMAQREAEARGAEAAASGQDSGMGLIEAIFNGETDLALALIKSLRPDSIEHMADPAGMTPLHWSVRSCNLQVLFAILT